MTRTCDLRFRKPPSPEQLAPVHPFQNHRACSGVIPGVNLQKSKIYMLFQLSMAERVGLSPPMPKMRENRRKIRIPKRPVEFCDHRCVPPGRPIRASISTDFEAFGDVGVAQAKPIPKPE